jgi:hypothetical protein
MQNNVGMLGNVEQILKMQFDSQSDKRKPEYGLKLAKGLWDVATLGAGSYYGDRALKWKNNRVFANGSAPHREFMDLMGIDGNQSYLNIDWNLLKVLPRYRTSVIQTFMNRDEEVSVKATDILSSGMKEREKFLAKFRMEQQQKIQMLEQHSGEKLESGYVPQDEDELDLYYKIEWKMPEESFFEKTINQVFENSNVEVALKRELIGDLIDTGVAATRIERVYSYSKTLANRLKVVRCKPERMVYNIFESPIGDDVSIIGEAYPLKISDGRRLYPKVKEQDWFKLAAKSQKGLNLVQPLIWIDDYIYSFTRPYDDYSIMVFDFEVKCTDIDYAVKTENQYGKSVVIPKKGRPVGVGKDKEVLENRRMNVYGGVWAIDTGIMMDWDLLPNMIRPYQNGVDVFFNYSIVIPNNDGTLQPSLMDLGIPIVRQMILCALNIQKMVALMKADGVAVDIAGLQDLDIGLGKPLSPMELMKVYDQTGRAFWDSRGASGVDGDMKQMPYAPVTTGQNIAQINSLIGLYNFWLMRLNDEWGVNADSLGAAVPAKRSVGVSKQQVQAANNATEFLYDHYLYLMEMNAMKIGYTLWDMIVFESGDYKKMSGISSDLVDTTFDINVDMLPKTERRERLQEKINIALQQGMITLGQASRLENIKNIKDAILYLEHLEGKAMQRAAQQAQQRQQMNAEIQKQSAMAKSQGKVMEIQAGGQVKAQTELAKNAAEMAKQLMVEAEKKGEPLSPELRQIVDAVLLSNQGQGSGNPQQAQGQQPQGQEQGMGQ